MRYLSVSDPLNEFLSAKNIIREVKSSSKIISFAVPFNYAQLNTDHLLKTCKIVMQFSKPSENFEYTAIGELTSMEESGIGRFAAIDKKLNQIKSRIITNWDNSGLRIPLFTGGMKFTIEHNDPEWKDYEDSNWILPELILLSDNGRKYLIHNFYYTRNSEINQITENLDNILSRVLQPSDNYVNSFKVLSSNGNSPKDRKKWKNMVNKGLEFIYEEKLKKVVLSRKYEILLSKEPSFSGIYDNLQHTYPDCGSFIFKRNSSIFFGATPEKLFSLKDNQIKIDALAGSAPVHAEGSLFTDKNIQEHDIVIDYIKNTIAPFTTNILLSRYHNTKKLNNISHIWSEISAVLNDTDHIFLMIKELFPTPAVCGTPRDKALNLIKKLEDHRRGLYAGLIGWFNFSEAGFYVSIRSALNNGNKIIAFAGCGIIDGSDPDTEFDETELKLIPILSLFKNENKSQPQYSLG